MTDTKQPEALRLAGILSNDYDTYYDQHSAREAAIQLREQHDRIAELEAQNRALKEHADNGCTRSHPHENMSPMCVLRTDIARLEHEAAVGAGGVTGLPDAQPFRSITWPKGREAGRMGDMTPLGESHLRVGFDNDNDVYVSVFNQAHGAGDIEFCTYGQGGGKSPRTREALIALMVAMEEDSKETPSFAFPPGAAIAQEGGK